jgi:hemerythrin
LKQKENEGNMPLINWKDSYSIGVAQIDEHHRHLFFLANRFHDIFVNSASYQDLAPLFEELIDYVIYHFAAEEQLMQEYKFPDLDMHRKEHEDFSRRLVELDKQSTLQKKHLLIETVVFLHNWLISHILQSDDAFGRFIALNDNVVSAKEEVI